MSEKIVVSKKSLENAMKLAFLSTVASENTIEGHCLFEYTPEVIKILATDRRNRLSRSKIQPVSPSGSPCKFTIDPRKILKLIKTIDTDNLTLTFEPETLTIKFFLSDNEGSFVSLPSFDPSMYVSISESFEKAYDLETVNAGVFLGGIQFIKGFLDQKDLKFSNMFVKSGVLYGTNGNNKAAAFTSPEITKLDELVFPISSFPAITNLIEVLDLSEIVISSTSNHIFISSPDKNFIFGFTKIQLKMPKIPVTVDKPKTCGRMVNKDEFIKKLNRLQLSGDSGLGLRCKFTKDTVTLSTVSDKESRDTLECGCVNESGSEEPRDLAFVTECRSLGSALAQFGGNKIDIYVEKKIILYQEAELEFIVQGSKVKKPFTSIAVVAPSKEEE